MGPRTRPGAAGTPASAIPALLVSLYIPSDTHFPSTSSVTVFFHFRSHVWGLGPALACEPSSWSHNGHNVHVIHCFDDHNRITSVTGWFWRVRSPAYEAVCLIILFMFGSSSKASVLRCFVDPCTPLFARARHFFSHLRPVFLPFTGLLTEQLRTCLLACTSFLLLLPSIIPCFVTSLPLNLL